MRKPDLLQLRGAVSFLSSAIVHLGTNQPTKWDGNYCDSAIEDADNILRKALWKVQHQLGEL